MSPGSTTDGMKQALLCLLILAGAQCILILSGRVAVLDGRLFDPDCYMHLQRALQMMEGGRWRLPQDWRVDAPFGGVMHWTSLFDLLLVVGGKALALFGLPARDGLFWWGSLISPLLLLPALPVFHWGFRPLLGDRMLPLMLFLLVLQGQSGAAFQLGRPDHQSLLMACFLVQLGCAAAMIDGRAGTRAALVSGLAQGLALWCSVEGLLFVVATAVPLAVAWVMDGRPALRLLRWHSVAALAVVLLALAYEQPEGALAVAQARLSLVHALALAGATAALVLALPLERHALSPRGRLTLLLAIAVLALAPVTAMFPDFLRGPWGKLDPALSHWHHEVQELRPLLPSSWDRLLAFLSQFAVPLAALPLLLVRLRRGDRREVRLLMPLAISVALFWGLAMVQGRWVAYVQLALLIPGALTVRLLWTGNRRLRTPAFAAVLVLQISAGTPLQSARAASAADQTCDWSGATRLLAAEPGDDAIVMTDLYAGPEILWRSRYRVVAGPYELAAAIRDTFAFMHGDMVTASAVLERRGIEQILLCRGDRDADGALVTALRGPAPPAGYAALPAPEGFVRYRVVR